MTWDVLSEHINDLIVLADREHRFRRKDGEWVWMEGNPRLLPGGAGLLNVLRDVTDRRVALSEA